MKRTVDYFLSEWKNRKNRKPLLLRGARQVGKTHAVRALGKTFPNFVEINLELNEEARNIFEKSIDPNKIVQLLSELLQKQITPTTTLLFFDEIQQVPKAITSLRYFYEMMPDLHVIAAGSLLEFAIEQVGIPVGRISTLYVYPLSFIEFLVANDNNKWAELIIKKTPSDEPFSEPLHKKLLEEIGIYLAIGGMPEAVSEWIKTKTSRTSKIVHSDLLFTYQQDFGKYARKSQIKYLSILFQKAIDQLSKKFMYSRVGEYKKRELEPALEMLEKAGILYRVIRSAGQGIPLGAQADLNDFKIIALDVGLTQALLKLDITPWFLDPLNSCINKGEIVEAFVGQEICAYSDPIIKESLFYWRKEDRSSQAEIDYLIQLKSAVIPIEVKSGLSKRLKSMQIFLESHTHSPYGLRFSTDTYNIYQKIHSLPLYAVIKPFFDINEDLQKAVNSLIKI